jgi:serine/threonine-protein kinase
VSGLDVGPDRAFCGSCGRPLPSDDRTLCAACLLELGKPGNVLLDRDVERLVDYLRVVNVIGEGPRGRVFLAEWATPGGGLVALKRCGHRVTRESEASDAGPLLQLDHPFVATVFEVGVDSERQAYTITEYVPGLPITRFSERKGLSPAERIALLLQAADAIYYAHALGVPHLNLQPSNLLVAGTTVKVLDFERAMPSPPSRSAYRAPEQVTGAPADPRSDIFALGLILRELVAPTPAATSFDEIVRMATALDPAGRYSTVDRFAADLKKALPG